MKTNLLRISLFALALPACFLASAPSLAANVEIPSVSAQSDLKSTPFEKRDEFTAAIKEAASQIDQRISSLEPEQTGQPESVTRAREELKSARADLDDRISALSNASAETWITVRDQALFSLNRVYAAYEKARAG